MASRWAEGGERDNTRATALKRAYSRLKQQQQHQQHRQHQQRSTPLHQVPQAVSSPLVSSLWSLSSLTSLVVSLGSLFSPSSLLALSCPRTLSLALSPSPSALPPPISPGSTCEPRLGPLSPSLRHHLGSATASPRVSLVLCATCLPCGSLVSYRIVCK